MNQKSIPGVLPDYAAQAAPTPEPSVPQGGPQPTGGMAPSGDGPWGWVPPPPELANLITKAAQAEGIDPRVMLVMGYNESRWKPSVLSGRELSPAGAAGMFQFMPETAAQYGVNVADPASSARGAAKYMRYLLNRFGGDYEAAIGAYHAGEGNMDKFLSGRPSKVGATTRDYVLNTLTHANRIGTGQQQQQAAEPMVAYNPTAGTVRTAKGDMSVDDMGGLAAAFQQPGAFVGQARPGEQLIPLSRLQARTKAGNAGYGALLGGGIDGWQAGWQELGGAIAAGVGADGAAESMIGAAADNRARQQGIAAMSDLPTSYRDVTLGNFGSYIGATLVQSAPYLAEFLAGGGIGKAAAAKLVGVAAEKKVAQLAAQYAANGHTASTAEALAKQTVNNVLKAEAAKAGAMGAKAGQFAAGYGSGFGDIVGTQRDEGAAPDYGYAAAGAVPYSLLNFLGLEGMLANGVGKFAAVDMKQAAGGALRRGVTGAAKGVTTAAPGEMLNEVGQELINQQGAAVVNPQRSPFDAQSREAYLESAFGALAAAGGPGAVVGGVRGVAKAGQTVDVAPNANPEPDAQPTPVAQPEAPTLALPNPVPEVAGQLGNTIVMPNAAAPQATGPTEAEQRAAELQRRRAEFEASRANREQLAMAQPGEVPDMFGGQTRAAPVAPEQEGDGGGITADEFAAQGELDLGTITRQGSREDYLDRLRALVKSDQQQAVANELADAFALGDLDIIEDMVRTLADDVAYSKRPSKGMQALAQWATQQYEQLAARAHAQQGQYGPPTETKDESIPSGVARRTTSATDPLAPDTVRGTLPTEFLSAEEARLQRRQMDAQRPGPMPQAATDPNLQARIDARIAQEEQAAVDAQRQAELDAATQRDVRAVDETNWRGRNRATATVDGDLRPGREKVQATEPAAEVDDRTADMFTPTGKVAKRADNKGQTPTDAQPLPMGQPPKAADTIKGTPPKAAKRKQALPPAAQKAVEAKKPEPKKPEIREKMDAVDNNKDAVDSAVAATQRGAAAAKQAAATLRATLDAPADLKARVAQHPKLSALALAGGKLDAKKLARALVGADSDFMLADANDRFTAKSIEEGLAEMGLDVDTVLKDAEAKLADRGKALATIADDVQTAANTAAHLQALLAEFNPKVAERFAKDAADMIDPSSVVRLARERLTTLLAATNDKYASAKGKDELNGLTEAEMVNLLRVEAISKKWARKNADGGSFDLPTLRKLAKAVHDKLDVTVVDENSEVPAWMQSDIDAGHSGAFYYDDNGQPQVVVFSQNVKDEADMLRTVVHEGVGHYGVFALLGDKVDGTLEGVYRSNKGFRAVADAMIAAGYDRQTALHEAIAALSERGQSLKGWKALVAKAREVLRSVLGDKLAWSDNDVAMLLTRAAQAPGRMAQVTAQPKHNRAAADVARALGQSAQNHADAFKDGTYTKVVNFLKTKAQLVRDNRHLFDDPGVATNPMEEWARSTDRAESLINEITSAAHPLIADLQSLGQGGYTTLGDFANRSTALRADPRKSYDEQGWLASGDEYADPVSRELFDQLVADWEALTPEQQKAYGDAVDHFAKLKDRMKDALMKSTMFDDAGKSKASNKARLAIEHAFNRVMGPYLPLHRAGEWLVVAEVPGQKNSRTVMSFENLADANAAADRLAAEGVRDYRGGEWTYTGDQIQVTAATKVDLDNTIFKFSAGSYKEVMDVVDNMRHDTPEHAEAQDAMRAAIVNIYTSTLPGSRTAERHFLNHRKGVTGASSDMPRAVADTSQSLAYLISRISTEPDVQDAMYKMRTLAREAGPKRMQRSLVYNAALDMLKRHRTPSSTWFSRAAGKFGFLWYLGFTPSFVALQAVQTPMLTLPVLAKRFGYANSANTLMQAARDAAGVVGALAKEELGAAVRSRKASRLSSTPFGEYLDRLENGGKLRAGSVFKADTGAGMNAERDMLLTAFRRNLINITMAYDVDAVANGEHLMQRSVMRTAAWASQQAEMFNRVTTALAAYRLAKADPDTQQQAKAAAKAVQARVEADVLRRVRSTKAWREATDQQQIDMVDAAKAEALATLEQQAAHDVAVSAALEALDMSQFDYSGANKARFMSGAHMGYVGPLLMFKSFAQHMLYLLLTNAKHAVRPLPKQKGPNESEADFKARVAHIKLERAASRKFLAGILATHTAVAGLSGGLFPGSWALANALSFAWDDDDDGLDDDAEATLYAYLRNTFGDTMAGALMYGLPRLVGGDIGSRTGLSTLNILPQAPINDGREGAREWITNALGPVASGVVNAWSGWDLVSKGEVSKGATMMLPKFMGDPIRAFRLDDKGLTTGTGLTAVAPDAFSVGSKLAQAIGFAPAAQQDYYRGRKVQADTKRQLQGGSDEVKQAYHKAMLERDAKAQREAVKAMQAFNRGKPTDDQLTLRELRAFHQRRLTEQKKYKANNFAEQSPAIKAKLEPFS